MLLSLPCCIAVSVRLTPAPVCSDALLEAGGDALRDACILSPYLYTGLAQPGPKTSKGEPHRSIVVYESVKKYLKARSI